MDDLYDLDDAALEEAFKAAKAELETSTEDTTSTDDSDAFVADEQEDDNTEASEEDADGEVQETEAEGSDEDNASEEAGSDESASNDTGTTDAVVDTSGAEAAPKVRKFKAAGKEYEVSEEEIFEKFPKVFAQAMDYTKKMQHIAPWRKSIDALEGANLGHDDINLMIDVFKGSKEAIAEVIKRAGVDVLDLGTQEAPYVATDYGRDGSLIEVQEVLDSIKSDPEYTTTLQVISKGWDDSSWRELSKDPEKIRLLHADVKSGMFQKLAPMMEKEKIFDGGRQSDIAYYAMAAKQYFTQQRKAQLADTVRSATADSAARITAVKEQEARRQATQQQAVKRKAAAPTTSSASARGGVINYLEAPDEEYEAWYKKLESGN